MSRRFKSQDYKRFKKLGIRWRRPVGRHSKLKINKGGSGIVPRIGYRSPNAVRFMAKITDAKGTSLVKTHLVHSINELEKIPKGEHVVLASSIGKRKIILLAEKARQLGLSVVNSQKARTAKRMQKTLAYGRELKKRTGAKADEKKKEKAKQETKSEAKGEPAPANDAQASTQEASKHSEV